MTNKEMLRAKIREKGFKLGFICEKLDISYPALKRRLDGECEFTGIEIIILGEMLGLTTLEEVNNIFFG